MGVGMGLESNKKAKDVREKESQELPVRERDT